MAIETVLARHAEDAAMLWLLRRAAVRAPHFGLADLAKLDGRLEAHLDGLRIAGDEGWRICVEQLAIKEPGEVFTASVLAFENGDQARIAHVLQSVAGELELQEPIISALGWLNINQAAPHIESFLASQKTELRSLGLAACAAHRRRPGGALREALRDENPSFRARACRAVGELGALDLATDAEACLASDDPSVRFWSAWTTALLSGRPPALAALQGFAFEPGPHRELALQLFIRRSALKEAKLWLNEFMRRRPEQTPLALPGAGILGDPELVPWLIDNMRRLPLARRAGEAFTTITGADLAFRDLERKPPADFHSGPTDDPKDENVGMDPDENLPWPEPALVQRWWDQNRSQFQNGTRYLLGKPISPDWLRTVLRDGRQRCRAAASLELAIRVSGQPLFNVKAPGSRQVQLLGKAGPVLR